MPLPRPDHAPAALWHETPAARSLLADLAAADLQLIATRGCPGPDGLAWHPATAHGRATFEALLDMRTRAIGPAFALATTNSARLAALAAAQCAPSVAAVLATRFGDPDRWLGIGPIEATRRFRASW